MLNADAQYMDDMKHPDPYLDNKGNSILPPTIGTCETCPKNGQYDNLINDTERDYHYDEKTGNTAALLPAMGDENDVNPETVGNWFYNYGGPNNPKSFNGEDNCDLKPKNWSDAQVLYMMNIMMKREPLAVWVWY